MPTIRLFFLLSGLMSQMPVFADGILTQQSDSRFVSAELGVYKPNLQSVITLDNGSNFPQPYNQDRYTLASKKKLIAGFAAGYAWKNDRYWIPKMALGLRYQHFASQNPGLTITQYSLPLFENYRYDWLLSSDALSLFSKINLFERRYFSPYLQAGLGLAMNQSTGYRETALPGVTARVTPSFGDRYSTQFTYQLGAGLDLVINPHFTVSLGYEFQDLGTMASMKGMGLWSGQSLDLGHYQTQAVIAGLTWWLA